MTRESKIVKLGALTKREFDYYKNLPEDEMTPEIQEKLNEYVDIKPSVDLTRKQERKKIIITKKIIWDNFLIFFKSLTNSVFEQTEDSINNIAPIINYFAQDEGFFNCKNIVRKIGTRELTPSFDKGILVVGNYGNCKTTSFKVLHKMFDHFQMPMKFRLVNAHDLVTEFESIDNPGDKHLFYEKYKCKFLYIDDVKKERKASNYGITEIILDVLEKRDSEGLKTFITCNYREGDNGNIDDAIKEFGERYGGHIYDRILGNYNIIKFTGKSFRR